MKNVKIFASIIMAQIIVLILILAMPHFYSPRLVKSWDINITGIRAVETRLRGGQVTEKINSVINEYLNEPDIQGKSHNFKVLVNNKNLCVLQIETTLADLVKGAQTGVESIEINGVEVSQIWISADEDNDTVNVMLKNDNLSYNIDK